jgi:hypothetical protein
MTKLASKEDDKDTLAIPSPVTEFGVSSTEKMMYWEFVEGGANIDCSDPELFSSIGLSVLTGLPEEDGIHTLSFSLLEAEPRVSLTETLVT